MGHFAVSVRVVSAAGKTAVRWGTHDRKPRPRCCRRKPGASDRFPSNGDAGFVARLLNAARRIGTVFTRGEPVIGTEQRGTDE